MASLESRGQRYFQIASSLKDDPSRFYAGDVADGLTDTFIVIGELPCLPGIAGRHVQGTLGNIHADTDCFLYH
jgi:hypothetical protein